MYRLPSGGTLRLDAGVLDSLSISRQRRDTDDEAGGQLFATFDREGVRIKRATLAGRSARRSRCHLILDPHEEQEEIDELFRKGLHFIGNWHTHPEQQPSPSPTDVQTTQDQFTHSTHELRAFVLLIVGTDEDTEAWLGVVDCNSVCRLDAVAST